MSTIGRAPNRMTGMFSGIDTDALVKAMVSNQQAKIDKLGQNKTKDTWKKEMLTGFNNDIRQFKDKFTSTLASETSLATRTAYTSLSVSMTVESSSFTVRTNADAKAGSYSLAVNQVATAATMTSGKLTTGEGLSASVVAKTAISDLTQLVSGAFGSDDGEFGFSINGEDFTFSADDTLKSIMDTVNNAKIGVNMSYSQITDSITLTSTQFGAKLGIADPGAEPVKPNEYSGVTPDVTQYDGGENNVSYKADVEAYKAGLNEYNNTILKDYNTAHAAWTANKKEFDTDQARGIVVEDTSGFMSHFGMNEVVEGQDAKVSINGGEERTYKTNNFVIEGMDFSIRSTTSALDFTLKTDTTASFNKIKDFVDGFNTLVDKFYSTVNEKKKYDYEPLTAEMRKDMSEAELKEWDDMAKKGLLSRDNTMNAMLNSLHSLLTETLGGEGTLASIGLKTSEYAVGKPWKLEIDETKLKSALENENDKVYNILAKPAVGGATDGGFINKMTKALDQFTASTKSNALSSIETSLEKYTKSIKEFEGKMFAASEKYYLQYAKLETAMGQLQSQQSQMAGMFQSA